MNVTQIFSSLLPLPKEHKFCGSVRKLLPSFIRAVKKNNKKNTFWGVLDMSQAILQCKAITMRTNWRLISANISCPLTGLAFLQENFSYKLTSDKLVFATLGWCSIPAKVAGIKGCLIRDQGDCLLGGHCSWLETTISSFLLQYSRPTQELFGTGRWSVFLLFIFWLLFLLHFP